MKHTACCPKCGSRAVARVPDNAHRYLSNSICITQLVTVKRVPVARYVCCDCGYVEDWVEHSNERAAIRRSFQCEEDMRGDYHQQQHQQTHL